MDNVKDNVPLPARRSVTLNVNIFLKFLFYISTIVVLLVVWCDNGDLHATTFKTFDEELPKPIVGAPEDPELGASIVEVQSSTESEPENLSTTTTPPPTPRPAPSGVECYRSAHIDRQQIELFPDVLGAVPGPHTGTNIFFHETSCLNGVARLNVRQACAVESAARMNPNTNVYLMYASPVGFPRNQTPSHLFETLATYPNVHFRNLDLWQYALDTPADIWVRRLELFRSQHLVVHMSDLLRLLSCYKWGGTYMDLDFVVRQSFEQLAPNYVAEETDGYVANSLMNFAPRGIGHLIVGHLVQEFVDNYNGAEFAANGPALLKRVLQQLCRMERLLECPLMTVFAKTKFYAVYGTEWERLMQGQHGNRTMEAVRESMAVHMWNAITAGQRVKLGEQSAYEQLAAEFCPLVFATVEGDDF